MALTENKPVAANAEAVESTDLNVSVQIINAATPYTGSYMYIGGPDHVTAANKGRVAAWTGAAGEIPLGFCVSLEAATGDTSASPIPEAEIMQGGCVLKQIAVTGVTAVTDQGKRVFLSDDATLTLTRPTRGSIAGRIIRWYTSTTCDVYCYGQDILEALAFAGNGMILVDLGSYDAADLATGNIRTSFPMWFHGKFTRLYSHADKAVTGSAGTSVAINLEIGGTNVTGGVVTIDTTTQNTLGEFTSGTAITAANYFSEGSLVDVEAVLTGAAPTAGRVHFYAECETEPGV